MRVRAQRQGLSVINPCHEAEIPLQLPCAVQQAAAGIVSYQVNFRELIGCDTDHIFQDVSGGTSIESGDPQSMMLQMQGKGLVTGVTNCQSVTNSLHQTQQRR